MPSRIARTILFAALITGNGFAEPLKVDLAPESLIKERLESGAVAQNKRQSTIEDLFRQEGCAFEEQPISKHSANVICTLPGQTGPGLTGPTIIIGGHFDFVDRGRGIVDDWSGSSLLPSLYRALKGQPRKHTYVFVSFAAEESGLVGSSLFVKKLTTDQKEQIRGFVNLECLGLNPAKVWVRRSTPALVGRLNTIAKALKIDLQGVNVDNVGDDDTRPFYSAHLPVITIHSLTSETLGILHSPRDQLEAIHFNDYYKAYELVAFYLAFLDISPE